MRSFLFLVAVAALALGFGIDLGYVHVEVVDLFGTPTEETTGPSEVAILTDSNFTEYMVIHDSVLVLFYAPWCPFSKQFLPRFEDAARMLHGHEPVVMLARVDAASNKEVQETEEITSYPSLKLYLDRVAHEYTGGRHHRDVVKWVGDHLQTEFSITSSEHLRKVMAVHRKELLVVGSFSTTISRSAFVSTSRHYDHVFFVDTTLPDVVDTLVDEFEVPASVKGKEFVALFNPHAQNYPNEKRVAVLEDNFAEHQALGTFIKKYMFPAVTRFSAASAEMIFESHLPVMLLVDDSVAGRYWPQEPSDMLLAFRNVSEAYRGRILFVFTAAEEPSERRLTSLLGMDEDPVPAIRLFTVNPAGHHSWYPTLKYKPKPLVANQEDLQRFVDDFLGGRLKPHVKSQPVPDYSAWKIGSVQEVVGDNFEELVRDSEVEFFIKFHAPWCGHCRRMEPAFNELAQYSAAVPTLRIGNVDATQNEVANLHFDSYPALLLFRAGEKRKRPLRYEGKRTAEDMLEWIAQNSKIPFSASVAKEQSARALREREEGPGKRRHSHFDLEDL